MFQSKAAVASLTKFAPSRRLYSSVVSTTNGIKVAAAEDNGPLASVSLVIKAGSRYETTETSGAAHFLKAFGYRNTQSRTSFRTVREAELNGATLTAEANREYITYTVQCFREAVPYFVDVLGDIATQTKFTEHEFRDVAKLVGFESLSARSCERTKVVEGVHQAAFRNGLGNSLYALGDSPVGSGNAVGEYARVALNSGRVAVVGTGIETQQLADLVKESALAGLVSDAQNQGILSDSKSKFTGGNHQVYESAAPISHYALAFSAQEAGTSQILAQLLGAQRRMKWSTGVSSLAKLAAQGGFGVESFAYNYSDAGMVGVLVSASGQEIKQAVEQVAGVIQREVAEAQPEAVQRAVAAAQLDAAGRLETQAGKIQALSQLAMGQKPVSLESVEEASAKVAEAAKLAFKSKPAAASIGLSQATAYVDTLGF